MRAGHMRVMPNITPETTVLILTIFEPLYEVIYFLLWKLLFESCQAGERPIASSYFEMLSQIFSDRIQIFAVVES